MMRMIVALVALAAVAFSGTKPVKICNDDAEWPPYFYYERDSFGKKTDHIVGASIDILDTLFGNLKYQYTFDLIPWKRCLAAVEFYGQDQTYEVVTDAGENPERNKKYLRSEPFYAMTPGGFYNRKKFPNGLNIQSGSDLDSYNLCGTFGYNFHPFKDAGVTRRIDISAHENIQNLKKLMLGRCDVFLSMLESVQGGPKVGQFEIPEEIDSFVVPNAKKSIFYMWVSRDSKRGEKLISEVNEEVRKLKNDGTWEKIFDKHIPQGSGLQ